MIECSVFLLGSCMIGFSWVLARSVSLAILYPFLTLNLNRTCILSVYSSMLQVSLNSLYAIIECLRSWSIMIKEYLFLSLLMTNKILKLSLSIPGLLIIIMDHQPENPEEAKKRIKEIMNDPKLASVQAEFGRMPLYGMSMPVE